MESASSYRVYRSSDLYSIPPTAITKRSHVADDGVGWSGFAFLVAVGIAIGGASLAAMHVVKPDAPPRAAAAIPAPAPLPEPVVALDPAPAAPAVVAPPAASVKTTERSAKPKVRRAVVAKPKAPDPVPTNPYDLGQVDRGLPPVM